MADLILDSTIEGNKIWHENYYSIPAGSLKDVKITKIVSSSAYAFCVVLDNNENIWAWKTSIGLNGAPGCNAFGAGIPTDPHILSIAGKAKTAIRDIQCTNSELYVLFDDNTLYGMGYNQYGQLGLGHNIAVNNLTFIRNNVNRFWVNTGSHDVGDNRCFIETVGTLELLGCGYNAEGQIGLGNFTQYFNTFQNTGLTNVHNVWPIGCNAGFTIIYHNNLMKVTGYNGYGQLGTGNTTRLNIFTDVNNTWRQPLLDDSEYDVVIKGSQNNLVVFSRNRINYLASLQICGRGDYGMLGNNGTAHSYTPILADELSLMPASEKTLITGSDVGYICRIGLTETTSWGYNGHGQLGIGTFTTALTSTPINTTNLGSVKLVEFFNNNADSQTNGHVSTIFAKGDNGKIYATGYGYGTGQEVNTNISIFTEVPFPIGTNIIDIKQFGHDGTVLTFVAIDDKGKVWTWGYGGSYGLNTENTISVYKPMLKRIRGN